MNLRTKIIVCLLIIFSYELGYSQLTLEDIFLHRKYVVKSIDDIVFYKNEPKYIRLESKKLGQQIVTFNTKNQRIDSIFLTSSWPDQDLPMPIFTSVETSNLDKYFLLKTDEERMFRRASAANYYLVNKNTNLQKIGFYKISFPTFSFDDKMIAYVKENNLFLFDIESKIEQQATTDGNWNAIINGKSDWVYEEEFSLTNTFVWSSKNNKIAYLKFNETDVKEYTYPIYFGQNYPKNFSYKYPKVGEQNATVTAHYFDVKKQKNYKIDLSKYSYEYIPRIFSFNESVYFMLLNRHQDTLKIVSYNFSNKQTNTIFTDISDKFIEMPKCFYVLKDNSFIISSEQDGYNHLYLFDEKGMLKKQLTKGDFEVTDFYGIGEKSKNIFYQSNENNEIEKSIYSVNFITLDKKKLSIQNGKNSAFFSNDFSCFIYIYSNNKTPNNTSIQQVNTNDNVLIENNEELKKLLSNIPQKEFIKIPHNNNYLNAWIIKPKDLDTTKKYPLLIYVYGGPNEQYVLNQWTSSRDLFYNFLAEQGFIVVCVDNRGTDGRGVIFKQSTFLHLGKLETEDQIYAAKYLSKLSYIDSNRIGIMGWSYGGYMSLLCILQKDTPFKTAIAVAPVTNWKFYDNIYTERYMHTIEENLYGYEQFNPIVLAKNLTGNLLLMHATADDNVHFQHSVEMINALNNANKNYQFYMYPDQAHAISYGNMRYDVFKKITEFLKDKL